MIRCNLCPSKCQLICLGLPHALLFPLISFATTRANAEMAEESLHRVHLHQQDLNSDATSALNDIVRALPGDDDWEDREGDKQLRKVKGRDLSKFSVFVTRICDSCQVVIAGLSHCYILIKHQDQPQTRLYHRPLRSSRSSPFGSIRRYSTSHHSRRQ